MYGCINQRVSKFDAIFKDVKWSLKKLCKTLDKLGIGKKFRIRTTLG